MLNSFLSMVVRVGTGLIPPSIWRLWNGARLSRRAKAQADRRGVDLDIFIWEITVSTSALAAILFALVSYGILPSVGQGFALANDQKQTAQQVIATRVEQLEWRLFDLKVKQCTAIRAQESAQVFTIQLNQLLKTYKELTGRLPDNLPTCGEL